MWMMGRFLIMGAHPHLKSTTWFSSQCERILNLFSLTCKKITKVSCLQACLLVCQLFCSLSWGHAWERGQKLHFRLEMVSCKYFRVDWHACDPSWSRSRHGQTDRQRDAVTHTDAWSFPAYNCSLITQSIPANGWLHNQRPLKQNDSPVAFVMEAKWNLSTCLRRAVWWDLHLGKREQERKREMEGERHGGNTLLTQHINHHTHGERKRKKCVPSFSSLCGLIISVKRLVEVLREMWRWLWYQTNDW